MPSSMPRTWDILISTIPHRHAKLCELLAELDRQWQPGLGVLVLRDNQVLRGFDSHIKRKHLLEASCADYVSVIDDDDGVAHDYVATIFRALAEDPDYVGFHVEVTRDGVLQRPVIHSLEYPDWNSWEEKEGPLTRDITHLNPVRRELALLSDWTGRTDEQWAMWLRRTGRVRTQVMIGRPMYFYRFNTADNFTTSHDRPPMPEPLPELPEYPWLTAISS